MAEKKVHKIVNASGEPTTRKATGVATSQLEQSTTGLRIGAFVLWIAAFVCEFFALKAILAPEDDPFIPGIAPLYAGVGILVIDMILVIIGSLLWKKANHIHPASEKNKLTFWLWNNMGVIAAAIAFVPFVVLLLTNKNADQKTKTIGTAVAAVALIIAGLGSYDWNPYSLEEQQEMVKLEEATSQVYWTKGGKVYHIYEDCQHLDRSEELTLGSAQEAEAAGKVRLCKTCYKKHQDDEYHASANNEDAINEAVDGVKNALKETTEEVKDGVEEVKTASEELMDEITD